jgi:hypothetical protein
MLPVLVAIVVAAFCAGLALWRAEAAAPAAVAHLVFAIGIMPLILGAMGHFVPVLSRSREPPRAILRLPWLALAAGILAVASLVVPAQWRPGIGMAATAGLAAGAVMAGWILARGRAALGAPHPGLYWYVASAAALALALAAALGWTALTQHARELRLLHLHLNVLGFVGLAALGTLPVLLPTAAGRADPAAAPRLRGDLKFVVSGAALAAAGAAWSPAVALGGATLLAVPVWRLASGWVRTHADAILRRDGAVASLGWALAGWTLLLAHGVAHGLGLLPGRDAILGFVLIFLLPLVTGAVSQLLPVWLRPGVRTEWHARTRQTLGWLAGVRGALFVAGGTGVLLGWPAGIWLAAAGLGLFALALLRGLRG